MKKQKRSQLISYFLSINSHQQTIQAIQNQLISHIRFNPVLIFKKISRGNSSFTWDEFKAYVREKMELKQSYLIKKYFQKHFKSAVVKLEEFTESVLPYTPNILREVNEKIDKQMETKYYDHAVLDLYKRLLEAQLKAIYEISLIQRDLKLCWTQMKRWIRKDIEEYGKKIDVQVEECSLIYVRKWMELWIEVDEYKILNIMRWFGGYEESYLKRIYENTLSHLVCTCPCGSSSKCLSFSGVSGVKDKSFSGEGSEANKLSKVKSASSFGVKKAEDYLRLFFRYVETIIKSQRRLTILREGLKSYRHETELILHQITSKTSQSTRLGKIIEQMHPILNLKEQVVVNLLNELENTKIGNSFIYSLFVSPSKKSNKSSSAAVLKKQGLIVEVFEVLYTYCLSKATLKSLARELHAGAEMLFRELDENNHGFLDRTDLKLILESSKVKCKERDLTILMNHFGDGESISLASLRQVLTIQKSN